jgi:hypothetical protein
MINARFLRKSLFCLGLTFALFALARDTRLVHVKPGSIGILVLIIAGAMCVVLGIREIAREIYGDPDCPWYCRFSGLSFFLTVAGLGDFLAVKAALELRPGLHVIAGLDPYALMLAAMAAELFWLLILEPPPLGGHERPHFAGPTPADRPARAGGGWSVSESPQKYVGVSRTHESASHSYKEKHHV